MALAITALMTDEERRIGALMDDAHTAMTSEMADVRTRCRAYLNWYSPPWNSQIDRHDAWEEAIDLAEEVGLTRDNFPIVRSCVDIWTSLEASTPPTLRAEAERITPPPPTLNQDEALANRQTYDALREMESMKADVRSARVRGWLRRDAFPLKYHTAVRRKNLYGFSWTKVLPNLAKQRPYSHVVRDPTNVYPIWSSREPDDMEAVLAVYRMSAVRADAKWGLGLAFEPNSPRVHFDKGLDGGKFEEINNRWYDSTRTMVWVEEFWWIDRTYDGSFHEKDSMVHMGVRVVNRIVEHEEFHWKHVPWTFWQNTDERDSYGWSDAASVIDINDEINRRVSQEGDIIGMYAAPRFQLLGSTFGAERELPDPFGMISLHDTERIEQILTRIDAFPSQQHFRVLIDELLPRVSGLPPIVWGLIANAQTSGRALTASWKATETRLAPKLMANEATLTRMVNIMLDYARVYDWDGSRLVFEGLSDRPFDDFRWKFPPMEPRDFQEVTMDAITRRDAGLTTTVRAMRDTGVEDAEDLLEEVLAEDMNVFLHPDKVQSYLLARRAEVENAQLAASLTAQPQPSGPEQPPPAASGPPAVGAPPTNQLPPGVPQGSLPPTQAGAPANAGVPVPAGPGGPPVDVSTMVQNGKVSGRFIARGQM